MDVELTWDARDRISISGVNWWNDAKWSFYFRLSHAGVQQSLGHMFASS